MSKLVHIFILMRANDNMCSLDTLLLSVLDFISGTNLIRPKGGHWMDPAFAQSLPTEEMIEEAWKLDEVADDCPPGVGLPGTMAEEGGLGNRNVHWRQIKSLMEDPFVQEGRGNRMKKLFEAGMGLVAAVPFSHDNQRGIVLFYSRPTANVELLRSSNNERFMLGATDLIGATYTIRKSRQLCADLRRDLFKSAMRKVKEEFGQRKSLGTLVLVSPISFSLVFVSMHENLTIYSIHFRTRTAWQN